MAVHYLTSQLLMLCLTYTVLVGEVRETADKSKFILAVPKTIQGKHLAISSAGICWCDSTVRVGVIEEPAQCGPELALHNAILLPNLHRICINAKADCALKSKVCHTVLRQC